MSLRRSLRGHATLSDPVKSASSSKKGEDTDTVVAQDDPKTMEKIKAVEIADRYAISLSIYYVTLLTRPFCSPTTPRKRRKVDHEALPKTPTPTAIGLMTSAYSTGDIDDPNPPPNFSEGAARPVRPHRTNATLVTPSGTRVIALPTDGTFVSPTKNMPIGVTTSNLLETACAHLIEVDPKLKAVVEKHHCRVFSPEGLAEEIDPFRSLVSGITAQQVSGAAASSIKNKFVALYNESQESPHIWPTPKQVVDTDIPRLRTAGLSQRKAEYIQGLAEKFASGELTAKMLVEATDEEVLEKLVAIRGLGKWSVEMFATFALKRTDILSTGDLGVQ